MSQPSPTMQELIRFAESEITRSEADQLEAQLADSPQAQRRLDRIRSTIAVLSEPDELIENQDLVQGVRQAIDQGAPPQTSRSRLPVAVAGLLTAVVAAAALVLWTAPGDHAEFRAKAVGAGESADRWVGIDVFRVGPTGVAERVRDRIRSSDALLFSYTNLGSEPRSNLMILGVDASGAVRWYHPAYQRSDQDPQSIAVEAGASLAELGEAIRHELAPGPMTVYALFTRQPMRVSRVEALVTELKRSSGWPQGALPRLPIEGSGQQILRFEVQP